MAYSFGDSLNFAVNQLWLSAIRHKLFALRYRCLLSQFHTCPDTSLSWATCTIVPTTSSREAGRCSA